MLRPADYASAVRSRSTSRASAERSVASWITPVRGFPGVEAAVRKRRDFRAIRGGVQRRRQSDEHTASTNIACRVVQGVESVQHLYMGG